ncbi:carbohydrate ABC transporter permease [Cohnella sp. WQ 127256]|uniref:carbohydrate ABC transporter permease n=1 Tax=Cohnella sp. WQ 127256 TaxID=2938790 RepID=UPI002117FC79|nr:carbohydrate ABC transporter permease [Cohnella sp. WQ 127256]
MLYRRSTGFKWFMAFNSFVMLCITASILFPFLHLLSVSLSDSGAVVGGRVGLLPKGFNLEAYARVFQHPSIIAGFKNSIIQTMIGTAIGLFLLTICAYPLSKRALKGRKPLVLFIMFTMFFSGGLIPTYMLVKSLGLIDSIWAIVLPFSITPYYLLLMMTYFQGIPEEIEESAMLDGLNPFRILMQIVLPLSKPILAAITLFLTVYYWNNWFNSMIYLNSTERHPVMMIIRNIIVGSDLAGNVGQVGDTGDRVSTASLKAAAIMSTTLPIMVLFPFTQKYFAKGVMIGSVKG